MENKVYKVLSEWKSDNLKEKFKVKSFVDYGFIFIQMYIFNNNIKEII